MNAQEVNRLLTVIALGDRRHVDDATVAFWSGIVGDLQLVDCLEAVKRHFAKSKDYLMPAHIRDLVRAIRDEHRPHHEALSLPSRFEVDEERIERVGRGIAQCAETLSVVNERRRAARDAEEAEPFTPSEQIRQRAIERARRERKGVRT